MPTILVVDDEFAIRELLHELLQNAGYQVQTAGDGFQALTVLREKHVDLVVTDIMMPMMDGRELAANMAADEKLAEIPVIYITAVPSRVRNETGGNIVGILAKPFAASKIRHLIRETLDQG